MKRNKLENAIMMVILVAAIGVIIGSIGYMATHKPHGLHAKASYTRVR